VVIPSQDVIAFLRAALECSVYVAPLEPGLTYDELIEVGKRVNLQPGEIGDALPRVATQRFGGGRLQPEPQHQHWNIFSLIEEPEYRNFVAFDFMYEEFNRLIRSEGAALALLERGVLVERAVAADITRHDIEVAITISLMTEQLVEKKGFLTRPHGGIYGPLPTEQRRKALGGVMHKKQRARAFPAVKDVIERRTDRRPKYAEPLDAFGDSLTELGYGPFRLWWTLLVAELRQSNAASNPVCTCVLAAALVEGALTFVVKHARSTGLGVLGSATFEGDPKTWRIDALVTSAGMGREAAMLNDAMRRRAEMLIGARQRIHAGRMLSDHPGGPPDLRPEQAREARETADLVVRAVLDWLNQYPPRRE
jgi:hypothetical protein